MRLSEEQMIKIIDEKLIESCSKDERSQVMAFAFGEEFLEEKNWYEENE